MKILPRPKQAAPAADNGIAGAPINILLLDAHGARAPSTVLLEQYDAPTASPKPLYAGFYAVQDTPYLRA